MHPPRGPYNSGHPIDKVRHAGMPTSIPHLMELGRGQCPSDCWILMLCEAPSSPALWSEWMVVHGQQNTTEHHLICNVIRVHALC